jgi:hypothetical protein
VVESLVVLSAESLVVPSPDTHISVRGMSGAAQGRTWWGTWVLWVGRVAPCTVELEDDAVGNCHAALSYSDSEWVIEDLVQSTGTFLNGSRIGSGQTKIRVGDVIRVGAAEILIERLAPGGAATLEDLASARTPLARVQVLEKMSLSPRKQRLFACACCRSEWQAFPVESTTLAERYLDEFTMSSNLPADLAPVTRQVVAFRVVETAERYADGMSSNEELDLADRLSARWNPSLGMVNVACALNPMQVLLTNEREALDEIEQGSAPNALQQPDSHQLLWRAEYLSILAEIVGPSMSLRIDPFWLASNDGAVVKLAQSIYEERRFADLPILGDALEDAGCTEQVILDHCREPLRHWRGCWLVDAILGKR